MPETNGEEWDRLEPSSALDALVELVLHGEYNGLDSDKRLKESLELRAAAAGVFENFVRRDDIRVAIVQEMLPPEGTGSLSAPPVTPLLQALTSSPNATPALNPVNVTSTHLAALLFSHLLRSSPRVKSLARLIMPSPVSALSEHSEGAFFVLTDGTPPPAPPPADDEEPPQTLLQILSENLSLAFLSRSRADTSDRESREWDRLVVCYLCLLSQWLWDDPKSVRVFLDAGGFGVLVEPVNQTSEVESIVPALCAFLLGVCYEYDREPGEITRTTIHPILTRLGVDSLVGRMARLREDERFKAVGPENVVLPYPANSYLQPGLKPESDDEGEIWFDWAFIDFWKSNYYTIQRGLSTDPDQLASTSGQNAETVMLVSSLRDVIRNQSLEIENLQQKLNQAKGSIGDEVTKFQAQIASLSSQLRDSEEKQKDIEKEQEDLLVLLDEVTSKRRRDKARLRDAGHEVSEDEHDDDDE